MSDVPNATKTPKGPPRLWDAINPPFKGLEVVPSKDDWKSDSDTAIVIDNGTHALLESRLFNTY